MTMTHNGHLTMSGHSVHTQSLITGIAVYFFSLLVCFKCSNIDWNFNFHGTYAGHVFDIPWSNNACSKSSAMTYSLRKRLCRILSCSSEEWPVPRPLGALPFLLGRCLCEGLGQSLVKRNLLNCLLPSKGDFAFFLIIDLQVCIL